MSFSRRDRLLLTLCCLLVLTPGLHVTLFDRDEGWYAQVVREMLASGDFVVPTYLGKPWLYKWPLVYWLATPLIALFGPYEWVLRGVSVVAMTVSVHLIATLGARLYNRRTAWIAAAAFLTAGMPAIVGRMFLMDSVMLALLLGAAVALERIFALEVTWRRSIAFWLCVGFATLTKGPAIAVYMLGMLAAIVAVRRQARPQGGGDSGAMPTALRPHASAPVAFLWSVRFWLPALPGMIPPAAWVAAVALRAGQALWTDHFGTEFASRFSNPVHGVVAPPGFYVLTSLAGLLPWTILLPGAILEAWRARRAEWQTSFLIWWLTFSWIALELVPGKLPHYVLPQYAPLILLFARMWDRGMDLPRTPAQQRALVLWVGLPIVLGLGIAAVGLFAPQIEARSGTAALGIVLTLGFIAVAISLRQARLRSTLQIAAGAMAAFFLCAGGWLMPQLEPHRLSRNVAQAANQLPTNLPILACGFDEPTMFFYLHDRTRPKPGSPAPAAAVSSLPKREFQDALKRAPSCILIVSDDMAASIPATRQPEWNQVRGFNYVRGYIETVCVGLYVPG